jgi:hypothetical protein
MKDLFIEEWDRLVGEYIEAGMTEAEAERKADGEAYDAMTDRYADQIDRARDAAKYAEFE